MKAFAHCDAIAIPLRRTNVDTDQICPSAFMKRVTRTGYEDALFASWREDPTFVLNREPFSTGEILVAGPNFGIGSSREHAVWAIRDYGIKVVISSQFADIFRSNSGKSGLLAAELSQAAVALLWKVIEDDPYRTIAVDLEATTITTGDHTFTFTVDSHTRRRLLDGLDDIDLTLEHQAAITDFEERRPHWKPSTIRRN